MVATGSKPFADRGAALCAALSIERRMVASIHGASPLEGRSAAKHNRPHGRPSNTAAGFHELSDGRTACAASRAPICCTPLSEASSHSRTCWVEANHPRRPGSWNISIGRRPAKRALARAAEVEKPINRAVSEAERIGLSGIGQYRAGDGWSWGIGLPHVGLPSYLGGGLCRLGRPRPLLKTLPQTTG